MARTGFRAAIDGSIGASYTVPAGKYAVFNMMFNQVGVSTPTLLGLFNGSGWFSQSSANMGFRTGPLVGNAGDVFAAANPLPQPFRFGLVGFLWDTSIVKIPFNVQIIQNSTVYTVPAGKIAVFNTFATWQPPFNYFPSTYLININSVTVSSGGAAGNPSLQGRGGPITANAGDVISCVGVSGGDFTTVGNGACFLSGFLYPA